MISEARKKVLLDIFGAPLVLFPFVVGLSSLILSWAVGGSSWLSFLGLGGLLVGVGGFSSRIALSGDLLNRQRKYEFQEKIAEQEERLDKLDDRLSETGDAKTIACLREIRQIYAGLKEELEGNGEVPTNGKQVFDTVGELFRACISQMEQTCELGEAARKLRGTSKAKLERERISLVDEVMVTASHLSDSVQQFRLWKANRKKKELSRLRQQLDEQLKSAGKVEQRLNSLSSPDDQEFEEFIKRKDQ